MDETRRLEELGEKIAREVGSGPDPALREAQRRAVMALAAQRPPARGLRLALACLATLVVAVSTFVLLEVLVPEPITFWVGDQTRAGEEGAWLEAGDAGLPIRFADGTRVELQKGAAGRVFAADREDVRVVLSRGRVEAKIEKETHSRWTVEAGPYNVMALGTVFVVSWGTDPLRLEVFVQSGRVEVKGPGIQAVGVRLETRDRLRLAKTGERFSLSVESVPETPPQPSKTGDGWNAPPPPGEVSEREEAIEAVKVQSVSRPPVKKPPKETAVPGTKVASLDRHRPETWQEFCDLGHYADAVQAAEKEGLERLLATLDDAQLWRLSDAARFTGRGKLAREALLSVRRRFRSSWRSRVAAFLLGRVAMEMLDDPREAAGWFKIYLIEDPDGPLAEESLGRRISACRKSGLKAESCRVAAEYLGRYPQGSFSEFARSVLRYQPPGKRKESQP
jgi:transmembrane sensor